MKTIGVAYLVGSALALALGACGEAASRRLRLGQDRAENDIGDATFFWMSKHDKIRQPAGIDWSTTNGALTTEAKAALDAACDGLAAPRDPLPTSTKSDCAVAILKIDYDGKTPAGAEAWSPEITSSAAHGGLDAGRGPRLRARRVLRERRRADRGYADRRQRQRLNGYVRV